MRLATTPTSRPRRSGRRRDGAATPVRAPPNRYFVAVKRFLVARRRFPPRSNVRHPPPSMASRSSLAGPRPSLGGLGAASANRQSVSGRASMAPKRQSIMGTAEDARRSRGMSLGGRCACQQSAAFATRCCGGGGTERASCCSVNLCTRGRCGTKRANGVTLFCPPQAIECHAVWWAQGGGPPANP